MPADESFDDDRWMIQKEVYIGCGGDEEQGGIIDILIENAKKKHIIVIENKIDTDDHGDQLYRYYCWMEKYRRDYKWRQLIYLTPEGRCPKSNKKCELICISYKKHIRDFLNASLKDVKAPPVREIVNQYLAILEDLTEDYDDETSRSEAD